MQKTMIEKLEDMLVVINLVTSMFSHMGPRTTEAIRIILEGAGGKYRHLREIGTLIWAGIDTSLVHLIEDKGVKDQVLRHVLSCISTTKDWHDCWTSIQEKAIYTRVAISFLNGLGYYDRNTACQSIYHLVEDGHLIPAVKLVRVLDHTMGLKEAKRTAQVIHKIYNQ